MRREVPTLLMNEKVTYIEFQGDLWVTLTFGFSHSQSVPWNFLSLLITIIMENMKNIHIPHFWILHKIKIKITIFYKLLLQ